MVVRYDPSNRVAGAAKALVTKRARYPERFLGSDVASERHWKHRATNWVASAIRHGLLPSLATGEYACVDCGDPAFIYEHRDYRRPLDVEPVCRGCNTKRGCAEFPRASDYAFEKVRQK